MKSNLWLSLNSANLDLEVKDKCYFLLSDFTLSSQDVCDSYSPEFAEFNDNHKSPTEIIKCVWVVLPRVNRNIFWLLLTVYFGKIDII